MLILENISYNHLNKDLLFENINLIINKQEKSALIGNNGVGKSTLFKIITQQLLPASGSVRVASNLYYVPQVYGQYNNLTVAQALGIEEKLNALKTILNGDVSEEYLELLNEDWTIEDRCKIAFEFWKLSEIDLNQKMESLSGGQKTKIFLAGITIYEPELILLDEPSNHLDAISRQLLYDFIQTTRSTILVISHDRKLLNILNKVYELSPIGIKTYGGNYDFYTEQKAMENNAFLHDLQSKEKELKRAKDKERETLERQQKLDARGKKKQQKSGVARIMLNTLRNNAENSTSKLTGAHAEKIRGISKELHELRINRTQIDLMKFDFDNSNLHKGKIIFFAKQINHTYSDKLLWKTNLNIELLSGNRMAIKGNNGSGKTTLIKIILGEITPTIGSVNHSENKIVYIDQEYSLIDNSLQIYEQAQRFNTTLLPEHELKMRLSRFLFTREYWGKSCEFLSGGEKMRLMICCLSISNQAPDLIIMDEPTNNLDIQNIEILTSAINQYQGTLVVVSHDDYFLKQIRIQDSITF